MIIWSGWGFLVVIIYLLSSVVVNVLVTGIMGSTWSGQNSQWSIALTFFTAGAICWVLGKRLNGTPGKVYIDKETGAEVTLKKARHRLFFIKMESWGLIFAVLGLIALFVK